MRAFPHPSPALVRPRARGVRSGARAVAAGLGLAVAASGLALIPAAPAAADDEALPEGRTIRHYTVRPGDTATGLATRFHAWTAELVAHNHLGSSAGLSVGQRLEIPVVDSAASSGSRERRTKRKAGTGLPSVDPSRDRVRDEIARAARWYGVDPQLALAVAWQESGWQMGPVSEAGAIGAMQVLPSTGRWMEQYAGRDLRLRTLRDNAAAGVLTLDVLGGMTRSARHRVGAYYQGPGAVAEHGLYRDTLAYVANVRAIRSRLERGLPPA